MNIKDVIAQAEDRLEKTMLFTKAGCWLECSDYEGTIIEIKEFMKSHTKDLLQSVIDIVGEQGIIMPDKNPTLTIEEMDGYNLALEDIIKEIK